MLQIAGLDQAGGLAAAPLHLAIGMFDGVHLGHRSVIAGAVQAARRQTGTAGVLTFWPHPSALFRPDHPTPLLMPAAMKRTVLARLGVDVVIEQEFSRDFSTVEAGDFVGFLQKHLPQLTSIHVGDNWRYGRGRTGNVARLAADAGAAGLTVTSVPRLDGQGAPISSSRIREMLVQGDMAGANALLGYAYFTAGVVQSGRQLGRTLGFPTLNLAWEPELRPCYGVYAVQVERVGGEVLNGVANYGVRPTVGEESRPLLEVHVLGEKAPAYGDAITVRWLRFLRPESKFGSRADLVKQIEIDREKAVEFFGEAGLADSPKDA